MASHNILLQLLPILVSLFAHQTQAQSSITDPKIENGGDDVDNAGGASGDESGSMSISKGGIIAISVIVGFVVIVGVTTAVLFVIAKRRRWEVRKSIKRMSRRVVGRAKNANDQRSDRADRRRGTVRLDSPRKQQSATTRPTKETDLEKGKPVKKVEAMEVVEKDDAGATKSNARWNKLPQGWSVGKK